MSKKILGVINAGSSNINSKDLAVKLCYLNPKGLCEEATVISTKLFKDFSYIIEYNPKEVDLHENHFVEISYADLSLRSNPFELVESTLLQNQGFTHDDIPDETAVDIDLTLLDYTIEITGKVETPRGMACSYMSVECQKISLSDPQSSLGDRATTDENGEYLIRVDLPFAQLFSRTKKNTSPVKTDLDIQIIVVDQLQTKRILSEIFYDVKNRIVADFIWGNENYMGLSIANKQRESFEKIPSLDTYSRGNNTIPMEQVEYISKKMEITTNEAARFINAKNMSVEFNTEEDIIFALLDENGADDYTTMLFKTDTELVEKVNRAIDNNTIYIQKEDLELKIADLKATMIEKYIQEDEKFLSKYEAMGILGVQDKADVVTAMIEWKNDYQLQNSNTTINDYLLNNEIINEEQYDKAVLYDGVCTVSEWNTKLAEVMLDQGPRISNIDGFIATKNYILDIIQGYNIQIPENFASPEEYVEHIDKMLEKEYPSQYLKHEICKIENISFLEGTDIKTFLNNNPDFQFGQNHAFVTLAKEDVNLTDIEEPGSEECLENTNEEENNERTKVEQLKIDLQKAEQLFQLTPSENKSTFMETLWNLDLCSAHQIAAYSAAAFNELISETMASNTSTGKNTISDIHKKANYITTITTLSMFENGLLSPPIPTNVIVNYKYPDGDDSGAAGLPTIKQLFGSQDYLHYPESRNMLSPAAYLMDLLQFIKSTDPEGENSPKLEKLFKRRPDIEHILLNCSNTDNIMPHIDLVNEILEIAAANLQGSNLEEAVKKLQTTWDTNDLIASPESVPTKSVYNTLKAVDFPWSLPFHFWLEEYRSYLKQISLSREELIKYFTPKTNIEDTVTKEMLYEYLGLTANEVNIITTQKPDEDLKQYYNNALPQGNVHQLINLSGLTFDEIKELITSHYINPENDGRYVIFTIPGKQEKDVLTIYEDMTGITMPAAYSSMTPTPGTLEATFIMKTIEKAPNPSPDLTFYDRLHRFERLRKKLNLKVHELDLIIQYLNINLSSTDHILKIAYFLKLKEQLNLKLEELLLLVNNFKFLDYPKYVNIYDYLFLRKSENYDFKEHFITLKAQTATDSEFTYEKIQTILPYISGIKISEDSYNKIVAGEKIDTTATVTIGGLSKIFRVAYICKALHLKEEEYYFLKSELAATDMKNPKNLLNFINEVQQIKSYGFSIADLAYILTDKKLKGTSITLEDDKIKEHLKTLQEELKGLQLKKEDYSLNHILNYLQNDMETIVDEALRYIFYDFGTPNTEEPEMTTVTNFINKHPDIFCRFQEIFIDQTEKNLHEFFLENGTETMNKIRAILVGLNLENEEILSPTLATALNLNYYSEQGMREILMRIKRHIISEILNATYNFTLNWNDNIVNMSPAVGASNKMDPGTQTTKNTSSTQSKNQEEFKSKYEKYTNTKVINLNIDVHQFMQNNPELFPENIDFLWPEVDNTNYISGVNARCKTFIFEKNIELHDEKVAELRRKLAKFLNEDELDFALNIILKPKIIFAEGDPDQKIHKFMSEKFTLFMTANEVMKRLYTSAELNNTNPQGGEFILAPTNLFLRNYCDRIDLVLEYLTQDICIDAIVRSMMQLCNFQNEKYMDELLFKYLFFNASGNNSENVAAIYAFLSNEFITSMKMKVSIKMEAQRYALCRQLYKLVQFIEKFKISVDMLDTIFNIINGHTGESNKFDMLDLFNIGTETATPSLKKYLNLTTAIGLSHTYFTGENNFFNFFCKNSNPNNLLGEAKSYIAEITDCTEADLDQLMLKILPNTLYINWFNHLLQCRRIISFLGVSAQTIMNELHTLSSSNITEERTNKLRQIVKNKYSESEWSEISALMRDPLRIKQRDALRDYLLHHPANTAFKSANDLFHHFLIDTEMIPMAKTSRIIQATMAVQLFIQRILMGMETGLKFETTEKEELVWRRNYRVWEANRKILFFPENWLDPELRHNKTEIFKSIEEKLLQNDIDDNAVRQAYHEYVEKLEEVANLEILSAYRPYSINDDKNSNFIAFVGRTHGAPHKYFYRKLDLTDNTWTPWEEITNGIKADMVRLYYWNNCMYMFWPEVKFSGDYPTQRSVIEIRMAWSQYKNEKWSKAVFSDDVCLHQDTSINPPANIFLVIREEEDNSIKIIPYFVDGTTVPTENNFRFNGVRLFLEPNTTLICLSPFVCYTEGKLLNNKAICTFKQNEIYFKICYYTSNNKKEKYLFTRGYNGSMCKKYNILYEDMCYPAVDGNDRPDPESVDNYIKPLVLEELNCEKNFLGIPYKRDNTKDIEINGTEIQNLGYRFISFYHPYITEIKDKIQNGYKDLFGKDFHDNNASCKDLQFGVDDFKEYFGGTAEISSYPLKEELCFENTKNLSDEYSNLQDPYAIYNWEMFYHLPMLIADNLSRNMRFEEAQKWYHLIFDPTIGSKDKGTLKYWKIKPFRELFDNNTGNLKELGNIQDFINQVNSKGHKKLITDWEAHPFNPHLVAQTRKISYMQYVVRKYLENIIAWADMYFSKDTREDINQAALLYILAADILGVKPQKLEGALSEDKSYNNFKKKDIDDLSNIFDTISGVLTVMANHEKSGNSKVYFTNYSVSYFGIPHNEKMEECWDTVADRLFKIRHCMNIQGVVRDLPLTSPPIDPGAIAAAMAAGADLSTALSTLSAPMPLYRFKYMLQKAIEFTNDVKAMGNSMLSVLEKCDAEELAILRTTHERAMLSAMTAIREKAIEEALKNIEALENSKVAVTARKDYYKNKKQVSAKEVMALALHDRADTLNEKAADKTFLTSLLGAAPQLSVGFPSGASLGFGGIHLGIITNALAAKFSADALKIQNQARKIDTMASYERRFEDWVFQGDQADKELKQINKQLAASMVRLEMAKRELENHEKQMELKLEEFEFMKEKFTNKQLYNWMKGQLSKLYQQAYQMAHKLASAAERAFIFEKQKDGPNSYITSAYWDNLKEGLMSGELLYNDLRRLEMEYIETNERDIELSKDISLAMIAPNKLNELRTTGECEFEIPEILFDIDHPGHYLRRIKSVSVSVPAVAGPFSGVTCKLSMINNRFRKSVNVGNEYAYQGLNDTRFSHNLIGIQSIATSSGNNDSGMFEFNFNDERYLPFEGAGAIGRWKIEMPKKVRKFNYATISDVILHVKYTAKDAGGMLKDEAINNITTNFNTLMNVIQQNEDTLIVACNLKTDFPDAFHQLCQNETPELTIEKKHLPFMIVDYVEQSNAEQNNSKEITIKEISFPNTEVQSDYHNTETALTNDGIHIQLTAPTPPSEQEDLYMLIYYKISN